MSAALCLGARVRHRPTGRVGMITRDAVTVVQEAQSATLAVYEVVVVYEVMLDDRRDPEIDDLFSGVTAADLEVLP